MTRRPSSRRPPLPRGVALRVAALGAAAATLVLAVGCGSSAAPDYAAPRPGPTVAAAPDPATTTPAAPTPSAPTRPARKAAAPTPAAPTPAAPTPAAPTPAVPKPRTATRPAPEPPDAAPLTPDGETGGGPGAVTDGGSGSGGDGPVAPAPASGPSPWQRAIDEQQALLQPGHLDYRAPEPMRVGDWQRVVVRVAGDRPPADFDRDLPGTGPVQKRDLPVGTEVTVVLSGPDFVVLRTGGSADDGSRTLPTGQYASWQWDVQPQSSGALLLHIEVFVRVLDPNGPPTLARTYDEPVTVRVNAPYTVGHWVAANWSAFGLTVPVLVGAVVAVRSRLRPRPAAGRRAPARPAHPARRRPPVGARSPSPSRR